MHLANSTTVLGLKGYTKGLIDIQTNEIWFEAKDTGRSSTYAMFTQLLHNVQVALNGGETVQPFLAETDVGWYQVRNALKARNASGDNAPGNFGLFELAYQSLTEKLQP